MAGGAREVAAIIDRQRRALAMMERGVGMGARQCRGVCDSIVIPGIDRKLSGSPQRVAPS